MKDRKLFVEMTEQEFADYCEYLRHGIVTVRKAERLSKKLLSAVEVVDDEKALGCWKYRIKNHEWLSEAEALAKSIIEETETAQGNAP